MAFFVTTFLGSYAFFQIIISRHILIEQKILGPDSQHETQEFIVLQHQEIINTSRELFLGWFIRLLMLIESAFKARRGRHSVIF
jgi:hypothetical protein